MKIPRSVRPGVEAHRWFCKVAAYGRSPLLLAVRLYWGWQFMQTGWGKLHNLSGIAGYFASLNIPAPAFTAAFVGWVELVGGLLLVLGLLTRLTGLVLTVNMVVAYWAGDHQALFSIFSDPGKFYAADPYTFLFASLMVLVFGAGVFSADAWIGRVTREEPTGTSVSAGLTVPASQS